MPGGLLIQTVDPEFGNALEHCADLEGLPDGKHERHSVGVQATGHKDQGRHRLAV